MSLWRAKRKYEANQSLNEAADDVLLAIALLRNRDDEVNVYSLNELSENLQDGAEIFHELQQAIEKPNQASNYYLALADHLRTSSQKQTTNQFNQELTAAMTALTEVEEDLEWTSKLNKAEKLLRQIEEFTSETSKRNADQMRSHLAGGTR